MNKLIGGSALLLVALAMLWGSTGMSADSASNGPAVIAALLVAVGLPGFFGIKLLREHFGGTRRNEQNKADVRQRTLEAEVLRLAGTQGGKLTIVEVVTAIAIRPEEAKEVLDSLAVRGLAEYEVTDSGIVVYDFHDVRRLSDKTSAKGILE